jgi:Chitin synthase export chaperone
MRYLEGRLRRQLRQHPKHDRLWAEHGVRPRVDHVLGAAVGEFSLISSIPTFVFSFGCSASLRADMPAILYCMNNHIFIYLPSVSRIKANDPPPPFPGRVENRIFLILYFLTLPFQFLSTGAVLEQGTKAFVILTAIHAGLVAALFWGLVANALVATQVVEDGTVSSIVVSTHAGLEFHGLTDAFLVLCG